MKIVHNHIDSDDELNKNLNSIFDDAGEAKQIMSCKFIRNELKIKFDFMISLGSLYRELRKILTFRVPTNVPDLTFKHKENRKTHGNLINVSIIRNWIFLINEV